MFSELLVGLAAVHAEWKLVAHAPALTLLPILLESRGRAHPTLLRAARREKPSLPTEEDVRNSKFFSFALGWTVGWLQTQFVPESAPNSKVFEVGNEALTVFEKAYEDALYGRVDLQEMDRFVRDGAYLLKQLEKAMMAEVGREAAEPRFDASSLRLELHPLIVSALLCDATLADEAQCRELRTLLADALRAVSEKQRLAWRLRYVDHMSDDDMARAMGVNKHTARTHLSRAEASIARGEYFATLSDLANECEDKAQFIDHVSFALAVAKASPGDSPDSLASLLALTNLRKGGTSND